MIFDEGLSLRGGSATFDLWRALGGNRGATLRYIAVSDLLVLVEVDVTSGCNVFRSTIFFLDRGRRGFV